MLTSLGVFSENESVSETSNGQLLFMSIGWAIGSCEEKRNPGSMSERKEALLKAEVSPVICHMLETGNSRMSNPILLVISTLFRRL